MKPPTKPSDTHHYLLGMDEDSLKRYRLFNATYQPATEQRFATLPVKPHMKILEVGCGIGQTACYMAQPIVPDGQVDAFDQSRALVETGSRYASENGIKNVACYGLDRKAAVFYCS